MRQAYDSDITREQFAEISRDLERIRTPNKTKGIWYNKQGDVKWDES